MVRWTPSARVAAYHALMAVRRGRPMAQQLSRRARAAMLANRMAVAARWHDAEVAAQISPTAIIGAVSVDVWPVTKTTVRIGPDVRLEEGVHLSLRGGTLEIGEGAVVRRMVTMHVGGELVVGPGTLVSTGVSLHCAESLLVGDMSVLSEYATVVDSWHPRTPPDEPIWHQIQTAPTRIGSNVWVGAHATVTAGVSVGDRAVVGAGAVVTKDVAPGWLVAGVPARPVRHLV